MEDFNERLKNFGNEEIIDDAKINDEKMMKNLQNLVEDHERIRNFVKTITNLFKITFFVKGIIGSVILCTGVFVIPLVSF